MKRAFGMRLLLVLLAAGLGGGCVSTGRKIPTDKVVVIREGETTREEIERLFGKPTDVSKRADGKMIYYYEHYKLHFGRGLFIPFLVYTGEIEHQVQNLDVLFGPDGKEQILTAAFDEDNVLITYVIDDDVD